MVQVLLPALAVYAFFLVFGIVAMEPSVITTWLGHAPEPPNGPIGDWLGERLSLELLRVSTFLAAFSGLYFTVYAVTDELYRKQFFTSVIAEPGAGGRGTDLLPRVAGAGAPAMTPVVLDCDTGTDDAVAILLAALHPDLHLLGVTTVWGNHDVRDTTDNTLRVLDLLGRGDIGVHPGRNEPVRPRIAPLPSGRADLPPALDLPAPVSTAGAEAVEWLVATLRETTEQVALVATGPLSNLAAALAADRSLVGSVARLVVLGGTHRRAGVTPYAERNVWCDPEAAADVLAARWSDLLLVTMDATFSAPLDTADAAQPASRGHPGRDRRGGPRRRPDRLVRRPRAAPRPAGRRGPGRAGAC
ncbi:hypothetical protein G5V59_07085 [Nocardioides sp. W3-2-3]|nr:hypothetical protein [Nocardioides convexus]